MGGGEIARDFVETRPRNMCESCGEPWELRRHWIEIRERYRPRAAAALISDRALARRPSRPASFPSVFLSPSPLLCLSLSGPLRTLRPPFVYPRFAARRCYRLTSSSY